MMNSNTLFKEQVLEHQQFSTELSSAPPLLSLEVSPPLCDPRRNVPSSDLDPLLLQKHIQVFRKGESALVELDGQLTIENAAQFLDEITFLKSSYREVIIDGRKTKTDEIGRLALREATENGRFLIVDTS